MITLIGTGHVFDLSQALQDIFDDKEPNIICVELDRQRYNALIMKRTNPEAYKNAEKKLPIIYKLLARFQQNMAKEYGVNAGDEMLTAINYAQTHQLPVEFIDRNAQQIFTKMWRNMPIREKFKLLLTGFGAIFVSKKRVEKELQHYQNNFDKYIEEIGDKFPTIKKTLIDDRNTFMTSRLIQLQDDYSNIIACIGDGHVPGIVSILQSKQIEFETIRLKDLRNYKPKEGDSSTAHFYTKYEPL